MDAFFAHSQLITIHKVSFYSCYEYVPNPFILQTVRYFLDISYKGTVFHGWQIQPNAATVQEEINKSLSILLKADTECLGSGRTDTGVHATQQIAHFDTKNKLDVRKFQFRLNSLLTKEVSVNDLYQVKDESHARFDATSRTYHYHLHHSKNPFKENLSYKFNHALDMEAINEANKIIKDWKNFQAFSKVHTDVNHYDCEIFDINWKVSNGESLFSVSANRFLRGMVRALVGTLLEIGQHKINHQQLIEILESGDRSAAGRSVPPEGLYLTAVNYPDDIRMKN